MKNTKAVAGKYIIKTVSHALDLIDQFQVGNAELGINDLSQRMNLTKNAVFRIVATLEEKKYIKKSNSTGKYTLGIKPMELGQVATRLIDYVDYVHPFLFDLKQQSNETCYFSIIKDGYTYFLDGVESDSTVRVKKQVGISRPLYCTAAGRALLAFMDPQKQLDLLLRSEKIGFTSRTITDLSVLQSELKKVAQLGYALDHQEYDSGVMEVAAPVFDAHGTIIGALSILGPEMRLVGTRMNDELIPLLCQSASRLSNTLGFIRIEKINDRNNTSYKQKQREC